ncbi:hybrid sensor histidine kinase/response regulator [Fluviicoccus keumensis]|nr:hybrid sensor histidine kinase/response regulator [Fluviicoccus keumensis]
MTVRFPPLFNHQVYPPRLQAEMLALGARVSRPHLGIIIATMTLAVSLDKVSSPLLAGWYLFAILTSLGGFLFRRRFWRIDAEHPDPHRLRNGELQGFAYSAAVGLLWGVSGLLMTPGDDEHNLILTIIYLGVGAGAGSIAIFGLGHMLIGAILSSLLFVSRFPVVFPEHWQLLATLFLLYHFVIVRMALERRDVIAQNMRLREDKEALLEQQAIEVARTKQANQDKSAFLAAASHDLRQPVHAVMLLGHALRLRVRDGESGELVEKILEAGHALSEQFNNLMDLSRLEGGAYRLNFTRLGLEDFLQRLCATHRQAAAAHDIRLRLRIDDRLRRQALYSDTGLLGRILDNLLANAVKFSTAGGHILVTARIRRGHVILAVLDQGRGIPPDQQENVFKPYVQLDNPTRDRSRGIGLGLSIVQEAASLLGARICLHSEAGRGCRFELDLGELVLEPLDESRPIGFRPKPLPSPGNLTGKRLLLVEDDPMAAAALIAWAGNWGLTVEHHADPKTVPGSAEPDLILCDIRLPGHQDGIEHLTDWLAEWPGARGLLLSGELSPETHERAEQEGLILLSKPVNPDLLLQTLNGLLRAAA